MSTATATITSPTLGLIGYSGHVISKSLSSPSHTLDHILGDFDTVAKDVMRSCGHKGVDLKLHKTAHLKGA